MATDDKIPVTKLIGQAKNRISDQYKSNQVARSLMGTPRNKINQALDNDKNPFINEPNKGKEALN